MIYLKNVSVHNLKKVSLTLPINKLIVFTGVSGSGKSSLAFDTIFAEGQRRYIESLSTQARRYIGGQKKPDAELIEGISPTISIEQKTTHKSPRSTVGTLTNIYDFLRILYARIGLAHCPLSGERVEPQSIQEIFDSIMILKTGSKIALLAPYAHEKKSAFKEDFIELGRRGYMRLFLDNEMIDLSSPPSIDGTKAHNLDIVIDRLTLNPSNIGRLKESLTNALEVGKGVISLLNLETNETKLYSTHAYSFKSDQSYPPLEPHDFSFNHPSGMCSTCQGLGSTLDFDRTLSIDEEKSISEDCFKWAGSYDTVYWGNVYRNLAKEYQFSLTQPFKKLSKQAQDIFLYGSLKKRLKMTFVHPKTKHSWIDYIEWKGVLFEAKRRYLEAKSEAYKKKMHQMMNEIVCPDCQGSRLKPYPSACLLNHFPIHKLTELTIEESLEFFESFTLSEREKKIAGEMILEVKRRLKFLAGVGLDYLSLNRSSATISGGESQRVRLASQIGSGLVGTTYVLDEPSIGLHPVDNHRLIQTLKNLRDQGNTVIVVEHDEETIEAADHIVDVGPGAGVEGGEILVSGTYEDLINTPCSLTGSYLSQKLQIEIPKKRRGASNKELLIQGAKEHNLKNITVKIPLMRFVAVTGVSGSGKSSLIVDTLTPFLQNYYHKAQKKVGKVDGIKGLNHLDKVISIDQSPIGRTPRSNPATYIKLLDDIRELFAQLPDAKAAGYTSGRFSFNVKEGCCPECHGRGEVFVDMDFMEDESVTCRTCLGKRYDIKTLSILYKEKSIYDVLNMNVKEALDFFDNVPSIKKKLNFLNEVGLSYMSIGQSSTTLSGGEAQRIKLAKELIRPSTGKTLYILDEPTTGLHFDDTKKLINILQRLVDQKNSVIVIEHNMDLVKTADYVLDLGPKGGKGGGEIIAKGPPESIASSQTLTGLALKSVLHPKVRKPPQVQKKTSPISKITVKNATQNNLKHVNITIPRNQISVFTGPSGSGKSSLAFETLYAEGQRRYLSSLPSFARQFVNEMPKPRVEDIQGLSPAISVEQKKHSGNPRSTIGTMTEIYDFLRLLFLHLGRAYCPDSNEEILSITPDHIVKQLLKLPEKTRLQILAPLSPRSEDDFLKQIQQLKSLGFLRIRLNQIYYELDEKIVFDSLKKNQLSLVIDRLVLKKGIEKRLFEAIELGAKYGQNQLTAALDDRDLYFNLDFAVPSTGKSYPRLKPQSFSFNHQEGMCIECQGLGISYGANFMNDPLIIKNSPMELILDLLKENITREGLQLFKNFFKDEKIDPDIPLFEQPKNKLSILLKGSKQKGAFRFIGLNQLFANAATAGSREMKKILIPMMEETPCHYCKGERLNPLSRNVKLEGFTLPEFCRLSNKAALDFIQKFQVPPFLEEIKQQIEKRLTFLTEIGLHYLSLDRSSPTLSGGETQRIHLARQLGSGLTGCLYILDEPTIGLHPHNNQMLNKALKKLRDLKNTLVLVEHDPLTVNEADYLFDFGPKAGVEGGQVLSFGTVDEVKKDKNSLTGQYLSGQKSVSYPKKRRLFKESIKIKNASLHNLKNITLEIPIGVMTAITGVSGSGKSTLIHHILKPALQHALTTANPTDSVKIDTASISGLTNFQKGIFLDQSPIGHTNRADIATYTDLSTPLRHFFASLPESKIRGLIPRNFSYNHISGMCRKCWGLGQKKINLQLMPSVEIECDSCKGFRLNPLSLEVCYKGKNLGQLLHLTVDDAQAFLPAVPKIKKILRVLISVGLGYLKLGQAIQTLSGGEGQRLRLSRELMKRSQKQTLYLFDEPTVGLHSEDIAQLLPIFHSLVESGSTLVLIEHNLDVIANCDYLIDLGKEAGEFGGEVIGVGTPEKLAQNTNSFTGKYLKEYFS